MMRVVLTGPHDIRVDSVEPAAAAPNEAMVQLRMAGICGSDLAAYRGDSPLVSYPRVLGHEILVDVLESPERPELQGRRAVVDPVFPDRSCKACRQGRPNCCVNLRVMGVHIDGGLQEVRPLDVQHLIPVPDSMRDEVAVLAEPLTIAYHAVQRARVDAGMTAVVFGAGTIGLLTASLLVRARGCRALIVDLDPARLQRAQLVGATPLPGDAEEIVGAVAKATDGDMADVVFEATGSESATAMTTALVGNAGRIILIGWNRGPVPLDTVTLMRKEVDLLGSRTSVNAFPAALQLLSDSIIDPDVLITHRFDLSDAAEALQLLDRGTGHDLKVLLQQSRNN